MKSRMLGYLSLFALIFTSIWLILLIAGRVTAGSLDIFENVLANVSKLDMIYYLGYINAAITVIAATSLFTGLYLYCKLFAPDLALMGMVFVPVYATLNLFVYFSQIAIVPEMILQRQLPELQAITDLLLRQLLQQWPFSGAAFFNNLAYAILGIPSIIFGMVLFKNNPTLKLAGLLLGLNGVACGVGFAGILFKNQLLGNGSSVGGVIFLLALIELSRNLLKKKFG
jgi:hypothetical protein